MTEVIQAAGGVVTRPSADGDEVLVVHRSRYGDWTLPKGKVEPNEAPSATALREVHEESAVVARLDRYLGAIAYDVNGRSKVVQYWRMSVVTEEPLVPNEEVAERAWLPIPMALARMSHPLERAFLRTVFGGAS